MNIFYSDMEPLSQYSPVTLHLSPATRILYEEFMSVTIKNNIAIQDYIHLDNHT